MEKLPSELLAKVLQTLPRYDLPSVRLINRTFAAEAALFLFNTIPLWIELKSLEALTSISEHPRLSKYVKTIAFSPLRFIELGDRIKNEGQVRDTLDCWPDSPGSHILHLEHQIAAYNSYIVGQRYLASGSLNVKLLSKAFSKLPKFKSLILDYQFHGRTLRLHQTFRGRRSRPDMVKMDGDHSFPIIFNALSNAEVAITALTIRDSYEESFWSNDSSIRLPESEINDNSPTTSYGKVSKALAKTFYPPHNLGCRAALRELRHFEVDVANEDDHDYSYDLRDGGNRDFTNTIRDIFKWSSQIESIRIPQTLQNSLWLMDLFPTEGLAKLQKVHLWEFETDLSDLLLFFQCHGRRLKDVRFISACLKDANWPTALHRLRSLEFPDLEMFFLLDCHDPEYCRSKTVDNARDYITGATDINPLY